METVDGVAHVIYYHEYSHEDMPLDPNLLYYRQTLRLDPNPPKVFVKFPVHEWFSKLAVVAIAETLR